MRRLVFLALLGTMACDPQYTVTDVVTRALASPPGGGINELEIVLPRGRALGFVGQPMEGEETLKAEIELEPTDPDLVTVHRTTKMNQFVLVAHAVGTTTLDVYDERGNATDVVFTVEVTP